MELLIDKMVAGGLGLGRLADGRVVLVPGVLPGELARVAVTRKRSGYLEAAPLAILKPAAARRAPPCPWYAACGGCDLQHVDYSRQLELKQEILTDLLARKGLSVVPRPAGRPGHDHGVHGSLGQPLTAAGQGLPDGQAAGLVPLLEPLAAPAEFHYRQRIRLQVQEGRPGFFRPGTHQLAAVEHCLLAQPELNRVWRQLVGSSHWPRLAAACSALELSLDPASRRVVALLRLERQPRPAQRQAAWRLCRELPELLGLGFLPIGHQAGPFFDREAEPGGRARPDQLLLHFPVSVQLTGQWPPADERSAHQLDLTVEPTAFSQVNEAQNRRLLARLLELLQLTGGETVFDLHCGMGNFSLPLARCVRQVHGVDLQAAAIRAARRNAEVNRVTNCSFQRRSAEDGLAALLAAGHQPDLLLLDPPRGGCRQLVEELGQLKRPPARIAMISCDPATMVRDLVLLLRQGYQVKAMQFVDMFPQTHHLETITILANRSPGGTKLPI